MVPAGWLHPLPRLPPSATLPSLPLLGALGLGFSKCTGREKIFLKWFHIVFPKISFGSNSLSKPACLESWKGRHSLFELHSLCRQFSDHPSHGLPFCSFSFSALLLERMPRIIQMFPLDTVCIAIAAEINMGLAWQDLWNVP